MRELASTVLLAHERLHVLINNAGLWHPARRVSAEGTEDTLQVNHLAPYLLTRLLLDRMRESAPARIIHLSSRLHETQPSFDFDDMQFEREYRPNGLHAYCQTKLANVMFSSELARRTRGSGVTSNAVHPGDVLTGIARERWWLGFSRWFVRPFLDSAGQAAEAIAQLATAEELAEMSGVYFRKTTAATPSPAAQDVCACERLWNVSAQMVGLDPS